MPNVLDDNSNRHSVLSQRQISTVFPNHRLFTSNFSSQLKNPVRDNTSISFWEFWAIFLIECIFVEAINIYVGWMDNLTRPNEYCQNNDYCYILRAINSDKLCFDRRLFSWLIYVNILLVDLWCDKSFWLYPSNLAHNNARWIRVWYNWRCSQKSSWLNKLRQSPIQVQYSVCNNGFYSNSAVWYDYQHCLCIFFPDSSCCCHFCGSPPHGVAWSC